MTRFPILDLDAPTSNDSEENEKSVPSTLVDDRHLLNSTNPNFTFESGEHEYVGNRVQLQFDSVTVPGDQFTYQVGGSTLTYGLVVALAGDFYGNYTSSGGVDLEQISDKWDTDPESSIALGIKLAATLSNDTGGYLAKVLATMEKERNKVLAAQSKGQDIAQIYAGFGDKYDKEYNSDTKIHFYDVFGAYLWISLCNWDHFGKDAYKAYSALHTAALRKAKEAYDGSPDTADATMVQAYFLEGYAQHFLTDLFASGHLRTPRRALHKNFFGDPQNLPNPWPADGCAQKMHNEDCANGLWVHNLKGEAWASYGDKQLFSSKSDRNLFQAIKAAQAGVDEVRQTRVAGYIPPATEFAALQLTPVLDDTLWGANYAPMFEEGSDGALLFRNAVDDRNNYKSLEPMPVSPRWRKTLATITASGEDTNMYPFTRGFLSSTPFVYLRNRPVVPGQLLDSRFGPLESGSYGSTWTMVDQFDPEISKDPNFQIEWLHAASLSPKVRSLVGRLKETQGYRYFHVGIQEEDVIWNDHTDLESTDYDLGDVVYGRFCFDAEPGKIGMIRYFDSNAGSAGKVEAWAFDSFSQAPEKMGVDWQTGSLSFTTSLEVNGLYAFFGLDLQNSNFCCSTWSNEYRTQVPTIISYAAIIPGKVIALIIGQPMYVISFENDKVWISCVYITIDVRDGGGSIMGDPFSIYAPITWGVSSPENYLIWFLTVSGWFYVVTLVMKPDYSLTVVVINLDSPQAPGPVISDITLDPALGSLLTAGFMTPLRTMRANYTYPKVGDQPAETTEDGIIMFFDNYGVLGARMLAPVTKDSLNYELKGQIPAIAGQPSGALGTRTVGAITEAIGILRSDVVV